MPWLDCKHDLQFLIVNDITMCIQQFMIVIELRPWNNLRQITLDLSVKDRKLVILIHITLDLIQSMFRNHDMNTVRLHIQAYLATNCCSLRRLDHNLVLTGFHCDLIMDTLEYNRCNRSNDCTLLRCCNPNILRTHNDLHQPSMLHVIHTGKLCPAETYPELICHDASKNITLADKVCNECIFRLIVYILRSSNLLHTTF